MNCVSSCKVSGTGSAWPPALTDEQLSTLEYWAGRLPEEYQQNAQRLVVEVQRLREDLRNASTTG